jgi:hypothetical protein
MIDPKGTYHANDFFMGFLSTKDHRKLVKDPSSFTKAR